MAKRARRTFTIDADISEKIDSLVDGHPLEINLLVNKALQRYLDWGRYVDSFKLITTNPMLMKTLWSYVPVDDARALGTKNGNDTAVEFILYYFHKFDLDSVLKTFSVIGAEYANAYIYSEFGDHQNRTVVLRHHMGLSASAFYGASLKALCDRLGLEVKLEESDDQVTCKIYKTDMIKVTPPTFKEQLAKRSASPKA